MSCPADGYATVGQGPGGELPYDVSGGGFDYSKVETVTLKVESPNGNHFTWSATISNQSASGLRATHVYASGEPPEAGEWTGYVTLAGSLWTGPPRSTSAPFFVKGEFER